MKLGIYDIHVEILVFKPDDVPGSGKCIKITTLGEEFWQIIKKYIPNLYYWRHRRQRHKIAQENKKRSSLLGFKTQDWKTWFDDATGQRVDNRDILKEIEKDHVMLTPDQAMSYTNKIQRLAKEERNEKTMKAMRESLGKLYAREHLRGNDIKFTDRRES